MLFRTCLVFFHSELSYFNFNLMWRSEWRRSQGRLLIGQLSHDKALWLVETWDQSMESEDDWLECQIRRTARYNTNVATPPSEYALLLVCVSGAWWLRQGTILPLNSARKTKDTIRGQVARLLERIIKATSFLLNIRIWQQWLIYIWRR